MFSETRKKVVIALFMIVLFFCSGVPSLANTSMEYSISGYDVNVRMESDGSLEITESIKYTSFGGYNNVMLLIDKRVGEEVEVESVYMLKKDGYIECDRLSAGQWDPNVFSGTYSVIQENEAVRVKVYGAFSNRYGSIVVQYRVKNAIKRYGDVAEYNRTLIPKNWEGRVSNINIFINLPMYTDTQNIKPYLHGVLVGRKTVESRRAVSFNVPDTVPGEYVETRVVFPSSLVPNAKVIDEEDYLEKIMVEESEYNESNIAELLEARENAAKEAGRKAWAERMGQRASNIAAVFSLVASLLGLYTLYKIQKELHKLKKAPIPMDLRDTEKLSPAEVRLVIANGRNRARGILGSLLHLVSLGYFKIGISKDPSRGIMQFKPCESPNSEELAEADLYLLGWVHEQIDEEGAFDPVTLLEKAEIKTDAEKLKSFSDQWDKRVLEEYCKKNVLATRLVFFRDLGLIFGALLFVLGCIIPVALSIWAGYTLLPVGIILFLYTLRIRKHTDYSVKQNRTWKELKKRMMSRVLALDGLPSWMTEPMSLMAYSVSLETENQPGLITTALNRGNKTVLPFSNDEKGQSDLTKLIKNTLEVFDRALSSVQEL